MDSIQFRAEFKPHINGPVGVYLREAYWPEIAHISALLLASFYSPLRGREKFCWYDGAQQIVWFDLTNAVAAYKMVEYDNFLGIWKLQLLWGWLEFEDDEA